MSKKDDIVILKNRFYIEMICDSKNEVKCVVELKETVIGYWWSKIVLALNWMEINK